ncbi:MAG: hypothetical protein ACRBB0_26450 [Pelagimonas sp.]|uniref:hypothetical protein n=1 Tax=Pelagimonas sp. TaxID=2073170 RepID=UPI003D6BD0CE
MIASPQKIVAKPRLLFRPDPVLGWSLTPNYGVRVRFRPEVVQNIDPDGWRRVPAQKTGPKLAIYGCSFTYGTGLTDNETYVARLQKSLPNVRFVNRGIGGHSTVQNFLQFRRDLKAGDVDAAIFAIFSDHRFRNIAHPRRMRQFLSKEWYELGVEHVPVLRQGRAGRNTIHYVPIWQPALQQGGFDVFLPDNPMIDSATLAILSEIQKLAKQHSCPIRFALLDQQDRGFNNAVRARFDGCLDISVPLDKTHSFLPQDAHPNQTANQKYASRLVKPAKDLVAQIGGQEGE